MDATPVTVEQGGAPPPGGKLLFAWFDGILEGPRGDDDALRVAERRLSALGIVRAAIETDGGRVSLLVDDDSIPGARFEGARDQVFDALQAVVDATGERGEVESTLRLTEVYGDGTRELLLAVLDREVRPVWRDRPTSAADRLRVPGGEPTPPELRIGRRNLLLAFLAFLLLASAVAWQSGWVGRMLAADATELEVSRGAFEGLLAVEIEQRFGRYEVFVARGPEYPADTRAVQALLDASTDLQRRAAVDAVANGAEVFVRLERENGRVLQAVAVRTAALLGQPGARGKAVLDGRIAGARITLALDDGRDTGGRDTRERR